MSRRVNRRQFLARTAVVVFGGALAACADEEPTDAMGADAGGDTGAGGDAGGVDTGGADSGATDAGGTDAGSTDTGGSDGGNDTGVDAGPVGIDAASLSKGPWTYVIGADVILAFETRADIAAEVVITRPDGEQQTVTTERSTESVPVMWPPVEGILADYPDVPGDYTVHEVRIPGAATTGGTWTWSLATTDGPREGRFVVPEGDRVRLAWFADTMLPMSEQVAPIVIASDADVYLHGGDIQYQSNPIDTWNGYFAIFGAAMAKGPTHHAVGNHEYEEQDEYANHYVRLFGAQGDEGSPADYHAFTWGSVRFIVMNSEEDFGQEGDQLEWLRTELQNASAANGIAHIVVAFHRPFVTFAKAHPNREKRDVIHPLLVEYGVSMVLTGHNHCYERFIVDGITYIVDGGGGAGTYDPNDHLPDVEANWPEELEWRQTWARTHGALVVDFYADGRIEGVRTDIAGQETDAFTVG